MSLYIYQRNKNARLILTRRDVRVLRALGIIVKCITTTEAGVIIGTLLAAGTIKGHSLAA